MRCAARGFSQAREPRLIHRIAATYARQSRARQGSGGVLPSQRGELGHDLVLGNTPFGEQGVGLSCSLDASCDVCFAAPTHRDEDEEADRLPAASDCGGVGLVGKLSKAPTELSHPNTRAHHQPLPHMCGCAHALAQRDWESEVRGATLHSRSVSKQDPRCNARAVSQQRPSRRWNPKRAVAAPVADIHLDGCGRFAAD